MGPTLCVCPGGSGAIVRIEGEIDVCVADRVQQLLLRIMRMHGPGYCSTCPPSPSLIALGCGR
jgi:hypothetical protein